jgi:hypothetical protein
VKRTYPLSLFISALALSGCGDDTVSGNDTDGSSTGDETATAGPTGSPTTSPPGDTTMGADSTGDTTPATDSSSGGESSSDGGFVPVPAEFFVRIENVSDQGVLTTPFSPGVWANHDPSPTNFFAELAPRPGEGLEELAEDGDPTNLAMGIMDNAGFLQTGVFDTPDGAGAPAPIMPGEMYEFTFTADPFTRLSLATMLVQSNDLLMATGVEGVGLFAGNGSPLGERDVTASIAIWDVGTESNQALAQGPNQAPYQAGPNIGAPESGGVFPFASSTRAMPLASALIGVEVDQGNGVEVPADEYTITFTNISEDFGTLVTPLSGFVWATHDDTAELFTAGGAASAGLETLAEDGDPSALATELAGAAGVDQTGTEVGLAPGESIVITVTPSATEFNFSFATMVVNSNDGFLAQAPAGVPMRDGAGMPRDDEDIEADILATLGVWDAGTEANEVPGVGPNQAPNQAAPGDGPDDTNPVIRRYNDITNDLSGDNAGGFISIAVSESGGDYTFTVTNTSGSTAYPGVITPMVYAVHDDTVMPFEIGVMASPGLEMLAEDGDASGLVSDLQGVADFAAVANMPVGAMMPGPLFPGDQYEFTVTPDATNRFLSIASMAVPSNDTFLAFDPGGVALINAVGTPLTPEAVAATIATQLSAWDAGTENNQAGAAGRDMAPFQAAANTGVSEGTGVVRNADDELVWPVPDSANIIRVTVGPTGN